MNRNLVESVDAEPNGGTQSLIAGVGDVFRTTFDGFDRGKTATDPLGNQTVRTYDPASNVIRVVQLGEPVNDLPGTANNHTLAVSEFIPDELSRTAVSHQVLFATPGASPTRTPVLTDNPAMDPLALYLPDAPSDTAPVPGVTDITVIGRVSSLTEYDRDSRAAFTVDDTLHTYRSNFDGVSRVIKTTDSALSNGFVVGAFNPGNLAGNTIETAYDADNNAIERKETDVTTLAGVLPEVFRTTMFYDALDRMEITVSNIGQAMDYRYDSRSNLVATADAVGPVSNRSLPRRGLGSTALVAVNDFGNVVLSTFDGISRQLETDTLLSVTGQGNGTFIGADQFGVKQPIPGGYLDTTQAGDGLITQYFAWDTNSQMLARRDDNGNVTQYIFDNQNRTKVERKALNFTGTSFTVAGGDSGAFTSFLVGTAPVSTRPGFTDITLSFDRDSNLVNRVDEAGNTIVSTFDGLNRRTAINITPAPGFIGTTQEVWTFDGLSRQTSSFDNNEPGIPNDDVSTATLFDSLARNIEETQRIGALPAKAVSYQFDIAASNSVYQPSALVYPDGRQVNDAYDNLDRLISRTDNGQSSSIGTYQYIGWRVATLTFQNNTRLTYFAGTADVGYDALRRVVQHRWEKFTPADALGAGALLVGFGYTYDRANNRLSQEKLHDPGNSELYSYRSDYELTGFARGTLNATKTGIVTATTTSGALQNQTWSLDGTGNWVANTHTTGGVTGTENRSHSNVNEIAALSGSPYGGNVPATFQDNNGNLLDDGKLLYKWDALNRLQQVFRKSDGLLVADYSYASDNRRFRKVVSNGGLDGSASNGTTDFYWSGWQTIEERDGADLVTQQYVYGTGLNELWTLDDRRLGIVVAQLNDGILAERKFYHTDVLSALYALSNETGQILVGFQYDAYGVPTEFGQGLGGAVTFGSNVVTVGTTVPANPYLYAGYRFDGETFLLYVNWRYYSADQGRFISRDPLGFVPQNATFMSRGVAWASDMNFYAYVLNNPTIWTDPTGLQLDCPEHQRVRRPCMIEDPKPNGCGTARFRADDITYDGTNLKPACDAHDICYATCGVTKAECDQAFLTDMSLACITRYQFQVTNPAQLLQIPGYLQCIRTVSDYYRATTALFGFGQAAFRDAQEEYCICDPRRAR